MTRTLPLLFLVALTGCASNKVYVRAMSAAAVDIPATVQRVAVVDRSEPKNLGQSALGALEGVVTGEVPFEDHRGRDQAIQQLVATLEAAPRFEVIRPSVTSKEVDSNLMDKLWDHASVVKLCKEHGCDAVIALETFDTDATVTSGIIEGVAAAAAPAPAPAPAPANDGSPAVSKGGTTTGDGDTRPAPQPDSTATPDPAAAPPSDEPPPFTHWAQRSTRLTATWRIYDADADVILDEQRDRVIGSTSKKEAYSVEEALTKLATASSMIEGDGRKLGTEYGKRISPTWTGLRRTYFAGGIVRKPGSMKDAKVYVKASDWDGAAEIWKAIVDDPNTSMKKRGKARHNLALAAEVAGQLKKAQKLAQKAAVENNNDKSRQYARSLERRIEEQAKVEEQLAPPEEGE